MEKLTKIEKEMQDNIKIAQYERELAQKLKTNALVELKKAKARETLQKIEYDLAEIKKDLAIKRKLLAKEKTEIKKNKILDFSDDELKIENNYAIYNEQISKNQMETAEVHKRIAIAEKEIAEQKLKLAKERLDVAKAREKLANSQSKYLKVVRAQATENKILNAKNNIEKQVKYLLKQKNEVSEKEKNVRKKENKLADLKKELSFKIAEREKIRHPRVIVAG